MGQVSARTCTIISRVNQVVDGTVGVYRLSQGSQMLLEGGHSWEEVSAKMGEGMLRLMGAKIKVCFPAGTQIAVGQKVAADGSIQYQTTAIEALKAGDFVLAREEYGPEVRLQQIEDTFQRKTNSLTVLEFEDRFGRRQTIKATDEHPFWIFERQEFVEACKFVSGMTVVGPSEERQHVVSVSREEHPDSIAVYNFCVPNFHTYFVSQSDDTLPLLVHNSEECLEAVEATSANIAKAKAVAPKTAKEARAYGLSIRDPGWPQRGSHATEAHHPLMQGKTFKEYWKQRGLTPGEVDTWTVDLDTDIHRAITESGWWDDQLFGRIAAQEKINGTLSKDEVRKIAQDLLNEIAGWGK